MFFTSRKSLLLPIMLVALILFSVFPSPAFADDETPTIEPTLEPLETPVAPSLDPTEPPPDESTSVVEDGTNVIISMNPEDDQITGDNSTNALLSALPIWCPVGVVPVPGQNGCTAEFGSISLLMDYLNINSLGDDGTIWISEFLPPDPEEANTDPGQPDPALLENESPVNLSGVDIIILGAEGDSLSLDSAEGTNALLNGQPIWCPDGITPNNGGDSCTTSVGSLGLLVSMMENGSLEEGAIYVQAAESSEEIVEDSGPVSDEENIVESPADITLSETPAGFEAEASVSEQDAQAAVTSTPASEPSLNAVLQDPIWCPSSAPSPDPGNAGCTPSQTNLQNLMAYLLLNEPDADGTIWIQTGTDNSASSIIIDGNVFTNWVDNSLIIQGGWSGTPTDPSITGNTTFSQSIQVINWLNDVSVNEIIIQGTTGTGLTVTTTGDIFLDNVSSNGNTVDGASLDNSAGLATNITLTGANSFNNNVDDGLIINSNGDISGNQITALGNDDEGAVLINTGGSGSVVLTGTNTFSNNGVGGSPSSGLSVGSNGSITINNITANNNSLRGVYLNTNSSSVILTGNNFFVNNGDGVVNGDRGLDILVTNGGSIDLQNITASGNTAYGVLLGITSGLGSGDVNIFGVNVFSGNSFQSLAVSTYGDINVDNITSDANTNGSNGASFGTSGDLSITNSAFSNNNGYGLDDELNAPTFPSSVTLDNVTFTCNALGDYSINSLVLNIISVTSNPCAGGGGSSLNTYISQGGVLPVSVVNLPGGASGGPVELNCTDFSGTALVLSNGNQVIYLCPTTGEASLAGVEEDAENFPGALPDDTAFVSAMETHLSQAGVDQALTTGELVISFVIPVDMAGFDFAILYFDGTNWLDLSSASFSDGKLVFEAGVKTEDGRFEASTNFTGLFVLVRK